MMGLVHALQTLSFTQCILIVPAVLAFAAMMLPRLRKALGIEVNSELTDSAAEAFGAIALFFVFITASSIATVQGFQKDGQKATEFEVAQITNLDRELVFMGGEKADASRLALKSYLNLIIEDEWKELKDGNSSEQVDHALGKVISEVNHFKGSISESAMSKLHERVEHVSDARDERIEVSHEHLSFIYWDIIFAFMGMLLVIAFFSNPALPKRIGLGGKMIALAFSLVLLIQTDGVFSGEIAVKPTLYSSALAKMKVRTADTE